jgi:DNA polymerase-4
MLESNLPPDEWPRIILHADMDAFFAAVEQHDRPELRGKAVLVGGLGRRGVVSTASYEARPYGVHSAMPMEEARRRCPHAIILAPNFKRYQEVSQSVMEVFASFSPKVEPLSLDEAFLDMTGAEGLFGPPEEMGRAIKRRVTDATDGLTVSVGAATTKFVAKVASDFRKPDGLTVVRQDQVEDFLWPQEVSRLWGVGPKTRESLERMGLRTMGDVARMSREVLVERLGALGEHIHRLSLGDDPREVVSEREAKSMGAEYTLEDDVKGAAAIRPHLKRAAERVARHLRREGMLAGGIRVKLKTSGFKILTRQARLSPPTDSERELERAADSLLEAFDLTVPMRLAGIAAYDLAPSGERLVQGDLFSGLERQKTRQLDQTLDAIRERFGDDAVRWGKE